MLVHPRVTPSNMVAGIHLCTWVLRVKCPAQEHNAMSMAKALTWAARSREERTIWKASCHRSIISGLLGSFNGEWRGFSMVCPESELRLVELFKFPG